MKIMDTRETLYDISLKISEPEYREYPAYSYSTIAKFHREGFDKLKYLYDKVESPSLLFGSMVDTLLTDGQEEFNNKYLVAEFPNISDTQIQIARTLFSLFSKDHRSLDTISDENLAKIGKECEYYTADKYNAYRTKLIRENCNEYYNLLFLSENKTVVSTKDYQDTIDCVNILRTHEYTKDYFAVDNPFDKTIERFYQLKFKGEYEGIPLRCMTDLIIVNHETKTIIPCDLKTSFKAEWYFYKSFVDWCYYIQAQLYWEILKQNLSIHPIYKDYTLENYRFIVISRNTKKPLVWEFKGTRSILSFMYGKENKVIPNWRTIVKDLDYYLKNNPDYPIGINKLNDIETWLNNE